MNPFNQPQRQSKIGIILLFVDTLQKYARAFLPLAFIWFIKDEKPNLLYSILGLIASIIIAAVIAYLRYVNFTFYIDQEREEFVFCRARAKSRAAKGFASTGSSLAASSAVSSV